MNSRTRAGFKATDTSAPPIPATPSQGRPKKWLSAAFNMASGFGFGLAAKAVVGACVVVPVAAPAIAAAIGTAMLAGALGGVMTSGFRHIVQNYKIEKQGGKAQHYTLKKGLLAAAFGAAGGGIAGGLMAGFSGPVCHALENFGLPGFSAPAPVESLMTEIPVAPQDALILPDAIESRPMIGACLPDSVQALVNGPDASDVAHEAAYRACSGSARASLQATKDLAIELLPKNPALAVELLHKAADGGNVQAIRDLAFLEFHGASGVEKNVEAALEKMETVMHQDRSGLAMRLMEEWTSSGPDIAGDFNIEAAAPDPAGIAPPPSADLTPEFDAAPVPADPLPAAPAAEIDMSALNPADSGVQSFAVQPAAPGPFRGDYIIRMQVNPL